VRFVAGEVQIETACTWQQQVACKQIQGGRRKPKPMRIAHILCAEPVIANKCQQTQLCSHERCFFRPVYKLHTVSACWQHIVTNCTTFVQLMKPIREKTKHFFLTANCRCVQDDCALVSCALTVTVLSFSYKPDVPGSQLYLDTHRGIKKHYNITEPLTLCGFSDVTAHGLKRTAM